MRKLLCLVGAAALALGVASTGQAKVVDWSGTLTVDMGTLGPITVTGTGVGTTTGTGDHIDSIHFGANTLSGTGVINVTDPQQAAIVSVTGTPRLPSSGSLGGHPGPLSPNGMVLGGIMRICLLLPGCGNYLPVPIAYPLAGPPFTRGAGIGGTATVNTFSKGIGVKISLEFNPWTIGLASMKDVSTNRTPNGGLTLIPNTNATVTVQGFVHGPASGTSSTAAESGVIQWVIPNRVVTTEDPPSAKLAVPVILRLHFVPEPGMLLLLASGVGGLVMLGRSRMRR
ncbi:MAG: hypothetical protein OEM05_03605 [Myxococcales bacterium]|nr:hypothetical protein [Myxococcales bacterium]